MHLWFRALACYDPRPGRLDAKSFSVRVCACACPPASRCLSLRDQDSSEHERPRWPIARMRRTRNKNNINNRVAEGETPNSRMIHVSDTRIRASRGHPQRSPRGARAHSKAAKPTTADRLCVSVRRSRASEERSNSVIRAHCVLRCRRHDAQIVWLDRSPAVGHRGVQKPRRPRSREPPDPPYEAEAKQNCELHLHVVLYRRDVIDLVEHIDILVVGL